MIRRDEHGAYHWTGTIDAGYEGKTFRIVFGVVGGICALFMIMSLAMGGEMMKVTLLSCGGALAVAGGVCWLFNRNAGRRQQSYIMTEDSISFRLGRYNSAYTFSSIKKVIVYTGRNMIELYPVFGSAAVFTSHEDFSFVRDFILQRIPDDAEVQYE